MTSPRRVAPSPRTTVPSFWLWDGTANRELGRFLHRGHGLIRYDDRVGTDGDATALRQQRTAPHQAGQSRAHELEARDGTSRLVDVDVVDRPQRAPARRQHAPVLERAG